MDEEKRYIPRLFDETLSFALRSKGAVVVVGPKWCGKSRTTSRQAKTIVDFMPTRTRQNLIDFATAAPEDFLNQGPRPLLIDEWQHISFIWDDIKSAVDATSAFGQFILTGSVTDPAISGSLSQEDNRDQHTGNGRIIIKTMRPMSLFESGDGEGKVSLADLKKGKFTPCLSQRKISDYAYYICRGGWPLAINPDRAVALQQAKDYYEMVVRKDIFSLKAFPLAPNEQKARRLMRSYARNVSTAASDVTLQKDCSSLTESFDKETLDKYLNALRALYVIEELPAWNPYLRSRVAIRSKPARHFIDPSIGAAALGLSPEGLFTDMTTFGLLFESLAIRDLKIYAEHLGGRLYKYRDAKNREADAVIVFEDGSFALVKVKLGGDADVEEAANKLKDIRDSIDQGRTGKCAFLMVITKGMAALQRSAGVYTVPLSCLKP